MAYSTFTFYEQIYHGNVVPAEDFDRIADRASDFLNMITFDRLVDGLPDNERAKTKVQKAVNSREKRMLSGAPDHIHGNRTSACGCIKTIFRL